jgi:hypothetical protein
LKEGFIFLQIISLSSPFFLLASALECHSKDTSFGLSLTPVQMLILQPASYVAFDMYFSASQFFSRQMVSWTS